MASTYSTQYFTFIYKSKLGRTETHAALNINKAYMDGATNIRITHQLFGIFKAGIHKDFENKNQNFLPSAVDNHF